MDELTFKLLNERNVSRAQRWHSDAEEWTLGDWGTALGGETGEALNVIKKIRRVQSGVLIHRSHELDIVALTAMLGKELGDIVIYADLVAHEVGIHLEDYVISKFNQVSIDYGFPERL